MSAKLTPNQDPDSLSVAELLQGIIALLGPHALSVFTQLPLFGKAFTQPEKEAAGRYSVAANAYLIARREAQKTLAEHKRAMAELKCQDREWHAQAARATKGMTFPMQFKEGLRRIVAGGRTIKEKRDLLVRAYTGLELGIVNWEQVASYEVQRLESTGFASPLEFYNALQRYERWDKVQKSALAREKAKLPRKGKGKVKGN